MGLYLFSQTKYHILTCFKVDSKHLNHSDKNFTPKLLNKVMYRVRTPDQMPISSLISK